jgi:phosphonate transport system permease protein
MKDNKFSFFIYYVLRIILNFIRSIEPLIWAIIFSVWVGIGSYAGMIALLVHSIASNAKLYSEAIEGIEEGPVEAISATGADKIQIIWYAVVPQIVLPFLSFTIYRWDINVRMATIIGLVGGGGIGTMLMQYQGLARWNEVGLLVIMIAFIVWVMDYRSAKIREAIY